MNELRLEKHFLEDMSKKKIAYEKGILEFNDKFENKLPNQLFVNLQHEAGLAEMYREDRQLLLYAVHTFRQIEGVFNDLFEVDKLHLPKADLDQKYKIIQKVLSAIDESKIIYWNYEFFSQIDGLECIVTNDNSKRFFNNNERIGKNTGKGWKLSNTHIVAKTNSKTYKCLYDSNKIIIKKTKIKGSDDAVNTLKKITDGNTDVHLTAPQQEKIYKWALYFNGHNTKGLSDAADKLIKKPQLNAYLSIKHYRDIAQHNIPGKRSIEQSFSSIDKKKWEREDRMYHKDPMHLMSKESTYYQRYLDAVIFLYSTLINSAE